MLTIKAPGWSYADPSQRYLLRVTKRVDLTTFRPAQGADFLWYYGERPPVAMPANATVSLVMVLHELATNAAKYGALSNPGGRVDISWRIERDAGVGTFHMSWIERGGPAVTPPADTGFGQTVIVRTVERALAAEVQLKYDADGVRWILQAPLAGVLADGRP